MFWSDFYRTKRFHRHEHVKVRFDGPFFNVFNHPNFALTYHHLAAQLSLDVGLRGESSPRMTAFHARLEFRVAVGSSISKQELYGCLRDASGRCFQDFPKRRIPDISVDRPTSIELRMIEGVKSLQAEFEGLAFADWGDLVERHVPVVHSRSVEGSARCVPLLTEGVRAKQSRVEVGLPVAGIVIDFGVSSSHLRQINAHRIDAAVLCVDEEVVTIAGERDRQPAGEPRDSRNGPALG